MLFRTSTGLMRACASPRTLSSSFVSLQLRKFSASPAWRDVFEVDQIIQFKKVDSPELTQALANIQEHVLMPSYLPEEERLKLRRLDYQQQLTQNPHEIKVRGMHKNIVIPWRDSDHSLNGLSQFTAAIRSMKTDADFAVLPALLRGWTTVAKRSLAPSTMFNIARRLSQRRQIPLIIALARDASETNFRLNHPEVIIRLLTEIQLSVAEKDYAKAPLELALRQVREILDIMTHDKEHKPLPDTMLAPPMLRDPLVLMARLHLAAALLVKHGKTTAEDDVPVLAAEMVALWPEGKGILDLQPSHTYVRGSEMDFLTRLPISTLYFATPVICGLKMAADAVRQELPDVAAALEKRAEKEEKMCEEMISHDKGGRRPMLDTIEGESYKKLVRG